MSVGKIFKVLIIVVACVIVGALVLNVLLPNATTSLTNAVERQLYNATGMNFDFNGDGTNGKTTSQTYTGGSKQDKSTGHEKGSADVDGFGQ